jgi:hypothetical protein
MRNTLDFHLQGEGGCLDDLQMVMIDRGGATGKLSVLGYGK